MKKIVILIFPFLVFAATAVHSQEAREKAPVNKTEQADQEMKTANQTPLMPSSAEFQTTDDSRHLRAPAMVKSSQGRAEKTAASEPAPTAGTTGAKGTTATKATVRSSQPNAANSHLNGAEPD